MINFPEKRIASLHARIRGMENVSSCWLWQGTKTDAGYGTIRIDGHTHTAHSVMYWLAHKKTLKPGQVFCHTCDVKNCVNPSHLYIGTQHTNMLDAVHRQRFPNLLTPLEVADIRKLAKNGMSYAQIGRQFNRCAATIVAIVQRKRYT